MIICFVAPADNYHTIKWCKYFLHKGYIVHVISFTNNIVEGVNVHYIDTGANKNSSDFAKLKYLFKFRLVKSIIDNIRPDIISVHYASSYGALAALSGIKNYTLSVWGSDVYDFPRKSIFHKIHKILVKLEVIGFDFNKEKIELYKSGIDSTKEVGNNIIQNTTVAFISDEKKLRDAKFHIVAVPTPVNTDYTLDLTPVIGNKMDGRNDLVLIIGDNVVLECNVVIVGDVKIGNNVIIGAGTVVVKDILDNCKIVGVL